MSPIVTVFSSFLLGLTGGFGHCIVMCSPFVLYVSSRFSTPASGYFVLVPQLQYNLGRVATYTFLGALVGSLGSLSIFSNHVATMQSVLTVVAGVLLLLLAFSYLMKKHFLPAFNFFNTISKLPLFRSPFALGLLLGFLPCGLVFGALILSAMKTGALWGALSMTAFGFGTTVSLMILSIFGGFMARYKNITYYIMIVIISIFGIYYIYKGIMLF